jgi:hypothetical protein
MMQTERRSAKRQGLNSLLYLDLEPDNGGILLNLSETGMQISVARRLVTSTEVRFTLCLKPKEKISGTGRIAWLSPSGRSAGVHFLDLPEKARQEIRQWMGQSADNLSARDGQEVHETGEETFTTGTVAVAPIGIQAPADSDTQAPSAGGTLLPPVEVPEPVVEAPPGVVEQTQEVLEPAAPATKPDTITPLTTEVESSQPSGLMLASAATEDSTVEASQAESPAPVPTDPLELLVSTVDTETIQPAPPTWAPPSMPRVEAPLTDAAGPQPSLLSLYGMDGREKEEKQEPLSAPPQRISDDAGQKTQTAAAVARIGRREARRKARAAARAPLPPRPQMEPNPIILGGLTDVSASPRPSAPSDGEAPVRARAIKLTNPIFVPAPPQFQLPPTSSALATSAAMAPAMEISPAVEPLPVPSPERPAAVPAVSAPPVMHATENTRGHGALYLPNYKVRGITPDGTWRASRLFLSPVMAIPEILERFEAFGWSIESDWHIWLALILLLAGFLSLVQNPPLVVLTVAFWFASAVVILDRKRPRHSPMRPQRPGRV